MSRPTWPEREAQRTPALVPQSILRFNPTMPCGDERAISRFAEGDLSDSERAAFEVHLAACADCQLRVKKAEVERMEGRTFQVPNDRTKPLVPFTSPEAAAVNLVPDNRVPQVPQVDPDLVGSAGVR